MKFIETPIPGLLIIEPKVFSDSRGYFFESFTELKFAENNIKNRFVQDNESKSNRGVIRGLHYQLSPFSQTKLIRVVHGTVYDVAVDLRKGSPTFGKWFGIEASAENKLQLYIPRGFAHGFSVLRDDTIFTYKCDNFYHQPAERGIRFDDPFLGIDWKIPKKEMIISEKDAKNPPFHDAKMNFNY